MKKKIVLGKKLFLNKETIAELSREERSNLLGGDTLFIQTSGCDDGTRLPDNPGGPATFGSLCGNAVWRTFNAKTVCTTYGGSFDC